MAFRLEIRFDYLCLFVPVSDPPPEGGNAGNGIERPQGEVVVVVPDLRRAPLHSFQIGVHHPVFRWKKEQQGNTPPDLAKIRQRTAQHRTLPTQTPSLEVTNLDGELVEIWIDGQRLGGAQPPLNHLKSLTSTEEFGLPAPESNLLYHGFLENPPRSQPHLKEEERMGLAARIHLRGGSFETEEGGLSFEEFFLADERGNRVAPPKRIARQVLWKSEEIDEASTVHLLFRKFGHAHEVQYLHLKPANRAQKSVSLSFRNCDEVGDFLLPGLPRYAAIQNFEPQVYQTLSASYTGFGSIRKISHHPIKQSANSVCAPARKKGTG